MLARLALAHVRSPTSRSLPVHPHLRGFACTTRTMTSQRSPLTSYLVTPAQLSAALSSSPATSSLSPTPSSSRIIPLCGSWFLPNDPQQRTGLSTFQHARIPHARFFDLDAVKDTSSPYPHMLPTAQDFAAAMRALGIRRDDTLVVYDTAELGILSAPRVAWTLRVFGHRRVHVLDNFRLWVRSGYPVETGPVVVEEESEYPVPEFDAGKVVAFREVKDMVKRKASGVTKGKNNDEDDDDEQTQILDLRSAGRFDGSAPEPRPGLSSGHMPGAINVPLPELLDEEMGTFLSRDKLREVFRAKGVDPDKPIVSTCGTGVMAAACDAALELAGYGQEGERRVYDGSWTEWAMRVKPEEQLIVKGGKDGQQG